MDITILKEEITIELLSESLIDRANKMTKAQFAKLLKTHKYNINVAKIKDKVYSVIHSNKSALKMDEKNAGSRIASLVMDKVAGAAVTDTEAAEDENTASLRILVAVIVISAMATILGTIFLGPVGGFIMSAVVVAPLVEEWGKREAIKGGFAYKYTGIFAGFEFGLYMMRFMIAAVATGNPVILAVGLVGRLLAVGMHFLTAMVQKYFHELGEEDPESFLSSIGYVVGVCLHAAWNAAAISSGV